MKCTRCHTEAPDESKFCPKCGATLSAPAEARATATVGAAQATTAEESSPASLFGFDMGEESSDRGGSRSAVATRTHHTVRDRPHMVSLADFGKPPPPAPPAPVNWRRRAVIGGSIAGMLGVIGYLTYLGGTLAADFYGGANELRTRDRFGTSVR